MLSQQLRKDQMVQIDRESAPKVYRIRKQSQFRLDCGFSLLITENARNNYLVDTLCLRI